MPPEHLVHTASVEGATIGTFGALVDSPAESAGPRRATPSWRLMLPGLWMRKTQDQRLLRDGLNHHRPVTL